MGVARIFSKERERERPRKLIASSGVQDIRRFF
jgi:hypothetical protein